MKNKRVFGILTLVVCVALLFWGLKSVVNLAIIKYSGQKVSVTVVDVPSSCDKYNHIKVVLNGSEYEVNISKANCRNGLYKVGQQVTLLKHKNYDDLVWPDSHPELVIFFILVVLAFTCFAAKKYYRKR